MKKIIIILLVAWGVGYEAGNLYYGEHIMPSMRAIIVGLLAALILSLIIRWKGMKK